MIEKKKLLSFVKIKEAAPYPPSPHGGEDKRESKKPLVIQNTVV